MDATEKIAELIKRYIEGRLTIEESATLSQWRKRNSSNESLFQKIVQNEQFYIDAIQWIDSMENDSEQALQKIKLRTLKNIRPLEPSSLPRKLKFHRIYTATAALCLCIALFGYYQLRDQSIFSKKIEAESILPGGNKAELILSDGQKINLRSDKDGIILDQSLSYSDGTHLLNLDSEKLEQTTASINVPAGGKYRVTLSDGTHVHLNAQSKLTYPLRFNSNKRQVSIEGEAYFEVAPQYMGNQRIPFEVVSNSQVIRVLGTSFNVSAYTDDTQTSTTLVEGSIEIESSSGRLSLQPNEQAVLRQDHIVKKRVDVNQFIAWKDNNFLFFETELRDLMKQISRWYNLEVSYPTALPATYFYGEITREKNLSEVLRILEKAGVKFELTKQNSKVRLEVY